MKRTLKILSIVMVAVILLTASVISVSAGQLPDGGQITNCGDPYAYGYTSGGTLGKTYIDCQIGTRQESTGDGMAAVMYTQLSSSGFSCTARQTLIAWASTSSGYTQVKTVEDNITYLVDNAFFIEGYTSAYTIDKATAGHQITISGYGSWIAGTTAFP